MRLTIRMAAAALAVATLVSLTGCGDGGQDIKPADAGGVKAQPLPAPGSPGDAPAPAGKGKGKGVPGGGPSAQ